MKVISADMTLDRISVIVNAFIKMKNAEAILVDKDTATILASRDSAKISTTLGSDGSSVFEQSVAAKIADRDYSFSTLDGNMTVFKEVSGIQLDSGFLLFRPALYWQTLRTSGI